MTGADVKTALEIKIGRFGSGYFDPSRINSFFLNSVTNRVDKKVEEFQLSNKVTREMESLIIIGTPVTPTSGTIDISQGSTDVPDYYSPIKILVTSPYLGSSLSEYAQERRHDQFIDENTEGTARYPRYSITAGLMNIEPADATSVTLTYFRAPFAIDVNDNSTQIPYNNKFIQLLIDDVIGIIGVPNRDQFNIAVSDQMQAKNP